MIQQWGMRFENDTDTLPLFSQIYKALSARGVQFPQYVAQSIPVAQSQKQQKNPTQTKQQHRGPQ
jgi:hypothetical protein